MTAVPGDFPNDVVNIADLFPGACGQPGENRKEEERGIHRP